MDLLQGHPALHPGQGRAQTEMGAVAEPEVAVGAAVDVERLGVCAELPVVVVGRPDQQQHRVAGPHGAAVPGDVAGEGPVHVLGGVVEAHHLLHRVGGQGRVGGQSRPLVGVARQQLHRVGHQLGGGLVPGDHEQHAEPEQLRLGQGPAVHLQAQQVRDQALPLGGPAPPQVLGEVAEQAEHALGRLGGDGHGAVGPHQHPVGLLGQGGPVGLGDAEHGRDHVHGERAADVGHQIGPTGLDDRVDAPVDDAADLVLHLGHPAAGEHSRHQLAHGGVLGRVKLDHHLLLAGLVAVDGPPGLQGNAARRREGPEVPERLQHVVEPAERPEPQIGVPVGGCILPQPPVGGVRVVVHGEGERVVDELRRLRLHG